MILYLIVCLCCVVPPVCDDACISVMQGALDIASDIFFFCVGGWMRWKKSAKAPGAKRASVPRGVFDYQASKRQTFTDSFPLCALSIPHSWALKVSWMRYAAEIKRLFWCLTVILIEGPRFKLAWKNRLVCVSLCANTCTSLWAFACLFASLFLCACVCVSALIWFITASKWTVQAAHHINP